MRCCAGAGPTRPPESTGQPAPPSTCEAQAARLKEIEHEADIITHQTYEKMHTTFLTPLDREDICNLVNKMDSILDMTEAAAARIILYRVKEPSPTMERRFSVWPLVLR